MSLDTYQSIHYTGFYILTIAVLEALSVYIWHYRRMLGAKPLVYGQLCKGLWLLFLVVAHMGQTLPHKLFWISLEQLMEVTLPFLWYMQITEFSRGDQKIPRMINYIFGGIVALLCLGIVTNSWTGLYWSKVWMNGSVFTGVRGPLINIALISSYLLNAINYALTVSWFIKTKGLRRRQALLFMIYPLFTWAGHFINFVPGGYIFEPAPAGFLLSGIYITWFFYRWRVVSILPHAQESIVRNMIDGLLIVDSEDYIVYLNPTAKDIFGGIPAEVGGKFQELADAWPQLTGINRKPGVEPIEIIGKCLGGPYYYQMTVTPLHSSGNHPIGKVIIFKDITQQKYDHAQLIEQQKTLSILAERNRLGREIHDGQGQIWSYLQLELQNIRWMLNDSQNAVAGERVDRLIGITKDIHTDVREAITGLKSSASSDRKFSVTLRDYLEWYEKNYGISVRLQLPKEPLGVILNPASEVQLLRIIQEALTNIRKHAKAQRVEVSITKVDGEAVIKIIDDGQGFDQAVIPAVPKRYGLQIMKERAEEAGGELEIDSKPGAGTTVTVRFKIREGG